MTLVFVEGKKILFPVTNAISHATLIFFFFFTRADPVFFFIRNLLINLQVKLL